MSCFRFFSIALAVLSAAGALPAHAILGGPQREIPSELLIDAAESFHSFATAFAPASVARMRDNVGLILSAEGFGKAAGTIVVIRQAAIGSDVLALTNAHVLREVCLSAVEAKSCAKAEIRFGQYEKASGFSISRDFTFYTEAKTGAKNIATIKSDIQILKIWNERDLALIRFTKTSGLDFKNLEIDFNPAANTSTLNERHFALGYPDVQSYRSASERSRLYWSEGEILELSTAKIYHEYENKKYRLMTPLLYHAIPIRKGSSGGPVFNAAGVLVAIQEGYLPQKDGSIRNVAVTLEVLEELRPLLDIDKIKELPPSIESLEPSEEAPQPLIDASA